MKNAIFKGSRGELSSKRIIGTACIAFSMVLVVITFLASGMVDVPANIQVISLQYLAVGGGMVTAGIFEKK